eukprot:7233955-Prymnesium_polylepis.2
MPWPQRSTLILFAQCVRGSVQIGHASCLSRSSISGEAVRTSRTSSFSVFSRTGIDSCVCVWCVCLCVARKRRWGQRISWTRLLGPAKTCRRPVEDASLGSCLRGPATSLARLPRALPSLASLPRLSRRAIDQCRTKEREVATRTCARPAERGN